MARFTTEKETDETTFPFKVDVPVKTKGFMAALSDMIRWCNTHATPWGLHSHASKTNKFARFYFMDQQIAAQFAQRWAALRA